MKSNNNKNEFKYKTLVAGVSAGAATQLALHPLDSFKTRLQGKVL